MALPCSARQREFEKFIEDAFDGQPNVRVTLMGDGSVGAIVWDDTTTTNVIYVGFAQAGTATSAASWRIMNVNTSTKAVTWADGNTDYDNIWDNRSGLSYS